MAKKKKKEYWTTEQEEAVREYLILDRDDPKSDILFARKIYPSLRTLVENIMFTYHLATNTAAVEDQIDDAVGFVALKMSKFDPEKGHKAFSYFGTIAKNYLILKKNKAHNKKITTLPLENIDGFELDNDVYEDHESDSILSSNEFLVHFVADDIEDRLQNDFSLDLDVVKLGETIIYLLRNYTTINVTSKNQFYFIVKERTGMRTKDITKALKVLKEIFAESKDEIY